MHISRISGALLCALGTLCAVDTKTWQQGEMADFEKGFAALNAGQACKVVLDING